MAGLYVHVPFCRQKCIYCDFCSYPNRLFLAAEYFECLKKELSIYAKKERVPLKIQSVYFGGGTPSFVDATLIVDFLDFVSKVCVLEKGAEITVECNPDSATAEKISLFSHGGVNRLSVGLQTANDKILELLNRPHNLEQFEKTAENAFACGIENLSADIILGLPCETAENLNHTLDVVMGAGVKHISAYGLSVERGTQLSSMLKKGKFVGSDLYLPDEDETADLYEQTYEKLLSNGFCRYEVSNFAISGYSCKHNINYWECGDYLGLGVSAHSYMNGVRRSNIKNLEKYISNLKNDKLPIVSRIKLSDREKAYEHIILGLRMQEGIHLAEFEKKHKNCANEYILKVEKLLKEGLLEVFADRVRVPVDKFYILNFILSEF